MANRKELNAICHAENQSMALASFSGEWHGLKCVCVAHEERNRKTLISEEQENLIHK